MTTRSLRDLFLVWGCYLLLLQHVVAISNTQSTAGWSIEGQAYRALDLPRSDKREETNFFRITNVGDRWRMEFEFEQNTRRRFCDVGLTADNRVAEVGGFFELRPHEGNGAMIHDSDMPLTVSATTGGYLWMALLSPPFLKGLEKEHRKALPSIWNVVRVNNVNTSWWQQAEWSIAGVGHYFPSRISYWNDGTNHTWNKTGGVTYAVPHPFQRGFTNAVYEVEEWADAGDVRYPKRGAFTVYDVLQNFSKTHIAPFRRVRFVATNFTTTVNLASLEPALKPGMPIVDRRVIAPAREVAVTTREGVRTNIPVQAGPVSYVAKSSAWPDRGRAEAELRRVTGFWQKVRWWSTGVVSVLVFAVFVWRWRRRNEGP